MKIVNLTMSALLLLGSMVTITVGQEAEQLAAPPTQQVAPAPERVTIETIKPLYSPPSQIIEFLGLPARDGLGTGRWQNRARQSVVEVRHNDAANIIVLSGNIIDVNALAQIIAVADQPPRQIEIFVEIVEINKSKARSVGLDWDRFISGSNSRVRYSYDNSGSDDEREAISESPYNWTKQTTSRESTRDDFQLTADARLNDLLRLLDESGVGTVRSAPRILTLNNKRARILDGQRVTYVSRYSSYTNLYQTDSMDAGLTLEVLPSLGESGFITMDVTAELTSMTGRIADSPLKDGQMLQNSIIVRDGQSVLLGGLTRTSERKSTRRFPILGHVLPFLFSREVTDYTELESYIILTPRIVDLESNLDEQVREKITGG